MKQTLRFFQNTYIVFVQPLREIPASPLDELPPSLYASVVGYPTLLREYYATCIWRDSAGNAWVQVVEDDIIRLFPANSYSFATTYRIYMQLAAAWLVDILQGTGVVLCGM